MRSNGDCHCGEHPKQSDDGKVRMMVIGSELPSDTTYHWSCGKMVPGAEAITQGPPSEWKRNKGSPMLRIFYRDAIRILIAVLMSNTYKWALPRLRIILVHALSGTLALEDGKNPCH